VANICFIPARNSSTRLKNKNIAEFKGGNLITNTITQAKESYIFDRIILSSNDESILEFGRGYGVETHLRDDSQDQIIGVVQDAIPNLDLDDKDNFCILLVTCPLRQPQDIMKAYRLFLENERKHPVVSVKKNENPIQLSFKKDNSGCLAPVMPGQFLKSTRKQDHYDTYYYNDAFIFDTVERFKEKPRSLFGRKPIPYVMPWERSIAIDYEFQLRIAQLLGEQNG
jgi:CMP-N-acetylneuraminic acid synthetase